MLMRVVRNTPEVCDEPSRFRWIDRGGFAYDLAGEGSRQEQAWSDDPSEARKGTPDLRKVKKELESA